MALYAPQVWKPPVCYHTVPLSERSQHGAAWSLIAKMAHVPLRLSISSHYTPLGENKEKISSQEWQDCRYENIKCLKMIKVPDCSSRGSGLSPALQSVS